MAASRHGDLAVADGYLSHSRDCYLARLDGLCCQHELGGSGWIPVDATGGGGRPRNRLYVADGFSGFATDSIGFCCRRKVGFHSRGTCSDRRGSTAFQRKSRDKIIGLIRNPL